MSNSEKTGFTDAEVFDAIIVGAGFSGLCMAIKLIENGFDKIVILEKADQLGGTWRDNTYPGAACDVQSHLYSYSFEGNPDWSQVYPGWEEIQAYIHRCAKKYQLENYLRYNSEVDAATFDEVSATWQVQLRQGGELKASHFILGTGPLHHPSVPAIPGLDSFVGKTMHSARWDHRYNLNGKRVVSIGTGASAIQYLPEIADQVESLTVMQRTPAWVLPRNERRYSQLEKWMFRRFPRYRKIYRGLIYWMNEMRLMPIRHPLIARIASIVARRHMKKGLGGNRELLDKLTPDYTIGCKRVLISNRYFPTFLRHNVELVTTGIESINEAGITTKDGRFYAADVIIFGTGFIADPNIYMQDFQIRGRHGQLLTEKWNPCAESYYGVTVAGFPNLFQIVGPNSGLGHNSVIFMIESQVHYIIECLKLKRKKAVRAMEVKAEVMAQFNAEIRNRLSGTVWTSGCNSWYTSEDGHNVTIWPASTIRFRLRTRKVSAADYVWSN